MLSKCSYRTHSSLCGQHFSIWWFGNSNAEPFERGFTRLQVTCLKLSLEKSIFQPIINALGHVVSRDRYKTSNRVLDSIASHAAPKYQKQLKSFLGICGFARSIIWSMLKLLRRYKHFWRGVKSSNGGRSSSRHFWTSRKNLFKPHNSIHLKMQWIKDNNRCIIRRDSWYFANQRNVWQWIESGTLLFKNATGKRKKKRMILELELLSILASFKHFLYLRNKLHFRNRQQNDYVSTQYTPSIVSSLSLDNQFI